jgi:hypothetical protein
MNAAICGFSDTLSFRVAFLPPVPAIFQGAKFRMGVTKPARSAAIERS